MRNVIITSAIVCLLAGPAFAQPDPQSDPPPDPQSDPPPVAPAQQPPRQAPPLSQAPELEPRDTRPRAQPGSAKRESTANLMTLGGMLVPVGLVIGAVSSVDTPSRYVMFMTSATVSALFTPSAGHWYTGKVLTPGLGLRLAGGLVALAGVAGSLGSDGSDGGLGLFVIGGVAVAAGIIYDAATAPARVRQYNRARGFEVEVGIAPVVTPHATGLALAGQF